MNAAEIKNLLVGRVEEVAAMLLPGGKRHGGAWHAGSTGGEAGDSLKLQLVGDKAGLWRDFAGADGDSGDVFTLWQRARGVDFVVALKQAKEFLGIKDEERNGAFHGQNKKKAFVRPVLDQIEPLQSGGVVYDYLTKVRLLDPAVLQQYQVSQTMTVSRGEAIIFKYFDPAAKVVELLKYLAVKRDGGEKKVWSSADSKDRLFGWQAVDANVREVVIAEGEIDCLTIAGWGAAAFSVPRGTNAHDWIEHDFEALERFEKIYLCMDMDQPGQKAAAELAQRLGRERCYRVSLPGFKDANEALVDGQFGPSDFQDCLDSAKTMDPHELKGIAEFLDAGWEDLHPSTQRTAGTEAPVPISWRCRFGELSIWTGWSGHGKSHLLSHFMLHDSAQGEKICMASFEMAPGATVRQLACMAGSKSFSKDDRLAYEESVRWLDGKFWLVNHVGVMHWSKLIPLFAYAAQRYGCTRFVADSLLRMGVAEDDYEGQKSCVSALIEFAAKFGHVHLVCHSRKGDDETKPPGKLDVRGAAAITDLCHNGFTVWRNKRKEQKIEEESMKAEPDAGELRDLVGLRDAQLQMWKNRKTGEEPFCSLWLEKGSGQFLAGRHTSPFKYLTNGIQPR